MKKIFNFCKSKTVKKHAPFLSFTAFVALLLGLAFPLASQAQSQFVKTYSSFSNCSQKRGNLEFNCITKSKRVTPSYFIAGLQDTAVYVAEVDANGVVLQEKLIGVNSKTYSLRSMITDDDGNIVIVGSATNSYPYVAFMMKISSALSLLMHRTYNNLDLGGISTMIFSDVKDLKSEKCYYISGALRLSSNRFGADALLLKVDRNTGAILASNKVNTGQEDVYDAFTFGIGKIGNDPLPAILATGRFSPTSSATMRPWLNKHDNALLFSSGSSQIRSTIGTSARLYSSSLILDNDNNNMLYCWYGQLLGTTNIGVNVGLASYQESDLSTVWQNEYVFTPQAKTSKFLNKIASDKNGYVAEGNWWDGSLTGQGGGFVGEMILLRIDKKGTPIWSRKMNNVLVNQQTHNAAFIIDNGSIFAVGKKAAGSSSFSEGALVKIPLADGSMDTTCAPLITVKVISQNYNIASTATNLQVEFKDTTLYNPILCTGTDTVTNCNQPCTDTLKLDADFDLAGKLIKGAANYIVTADNFNTVPNSKWIVSEVDLTTFLDKPATVWVGAPNGPWGVSTSTQFNGYYGAENASGTPGFFGISKRFRFKHILTSTNNCGITKADTVVKTIYMCPGCKTTNGGNGIMVETEKGSSSGNTRSVASQLPATESADVRIMPNPVSGSTITLEYAVQNNSPVQVNIQDMQGRKLAGKQFAANTKTNGRYTMDVSSLPNGTYAIVISNDGKTTTQKFVVAR